MMEQATRESPDLKDERSTVEAPAGHSDASVARQTAAAPPTPSNAAIPSLQDRIPKLEPRRRRAPQSNSLPVPEAPDLPAPPEDLSSWTFQVPRKRIVSQKDHELFLKSPTYGLILSFVFTLADTVVDTPISAVRDADLSPAAKNILRILDEIEALVKATPPDDQGGSRFGNKAFRTFVDKLRAQAPAWHHDRLGIASPAAVAEVATYLAQAFGSRTRIDYGSGHELHFAVWLLCLYQLRIVARADFRALALRVFARYLAAARAAQLAYYLEPAGSHGVWGLDDYQFLPFLLGAAQLLHHPAVTPRAVHSELALDEYGADYLYLGQVAFVNSTKTVRGLRWHSPMLDDISAAKSWAKIEAGMRRMFVAEVLGKLPVMQHFLFGSLVPAAEGMSQPAAGDGDGDAEDAYEAEDGEGGDKIEFVKDGVQHVHQPNGWGDCCGIKVPSSIGAAQEMRKKGNGEQLRRIPFD